MRCSPALSLKSCVLKTFFCFLSLKQGGIILSCWGMIASPTRAALIVYFTQKILIELSRYEDTASEVLFVNLGLVTLFALVAAELVNVYFSYQLLLGIWEAGWLISKASSQTNSTFQQDDALRLKGYLLLDGIITIAVFFALFFSFFLTYKIIYIPAFAAASVIKAYLWLCVYSLYVNTNRPSSSPTNGESSIAWWKRSANKILPNFRSNVNMKSLFLLLCWVKHAARMVLAWVIGNDLSWRSVN